MNTIGEIANKRVLLIEDNQQTIDWLPSYFREYPHVIIDMAKSYEEAIRCLDEQSYSCVVLDWRLSDGPDAAENSTKIVEHVAKVLPGESNFNIPIIIITANLTSARPQLSNVYNRIVGPMSKLRSPQIRAAMRAALGIDGSDKI